MMIFNDMEVNKIPDAAIYFQSSLALQCAQQALHFLLHFQRKQNKLC